MAFGGWNGPHPDASVDGRTWWEAWRSWNAQGVFDGVDWDLEGGLACVSAKHASAGHDDPTAPTTELSEAVLDVVVEFTRLARENGLVVGLAPAESYLDSRGDERVSRRLNFQPLVNWGLDFPYAGRNAYALLLRRADFDFVSLQFYEGYSRACYQTTRAGVDLAEYLRETTQRLAAGFDVRDEKDEVFRVQVPPSKLVLGFANQWADGTKFLRADPSDVVRAFALLRSDPCGEPRGVMFWVIDEEGSFARDLNF